MPTNEPSKLQQAAGSAFQLGAALAHTAAQHINEKSGGKIQINLGGVGAVKGVGKGEAGMNGGRCTFVCSDL